MSQVQPGKFRCDACGRRFTWRAEIAGREAKCPCGNTVICPEREPGADDDLYDLAPTPIVAPAAGEQKSGAATASGAVPVLPLSNPVAAAWARSTPLSGKPAGGRALAYATAKHDKSDPVGVIHLQAALWILAGSVCVEVAAAYFQATPLLGFTALVQRLGLGLLASTALMLVAVLIAAKFRGIALGPFWPAVIKLAAISIGPGAAVDLMRPILMLIPLGGLVGLLVQFVLFFALLGVFFDLDESDTWYCLVVMFIVDAAVVVTAAFVWR